MLKKRGIIVFLLGLFLMLFLVGINQVSAQGTSPTEGTTEATQTATDDLDAPVSNQNTNSPATDDTSTPTDSTDPTALPEPTTEATPLIQPISDETNTQDQAITFTLKDRVNTILAWIFVIVITLLGVGILSKIVRSFSIDEGTLYQPDSEKEEKAEE